jgi:hypothetical protein
VLTVDREAKEGVGDGGEATMGRREVGVFPLPTVEGTSPFQDSKEYSSKVTVVGLSVAMVQKARRLGCGKGGREKKVSRECNDSGSEGGRTCDAGTEEQTTPSMDQEKALEAVVGRPEETKESMLLIELGRRWGEDARRR